MAATNSTANLELSQFVGTDKPDWLTDYNGDMLKIDTAYGGVSALAEEAAANAESAAASAAQAAEDAAAAVADVAGAVEAANAATAAAELATTTANSALSVANGAASTAQAAAGDATTALSVANNAKVTAENAQAAAAQAATEAQTAATSATSAQTAAETAASAAQAASGSVYENLDTSAENCITPTENENWQSFFSRLAAKIDFTKLTENSRIIKAYRFNGEWRYMCYKLRTYSFTNNIRDAIFMALNGTIASSGSASNFAHYIMHVRSDGLGDDGYIVTPASGQMTYNRSADTAVVGTYYSFFIFY